MITTLTIKNYALIDDLKVTFSEGLSIITGETGAGKSIILGGLSLLLGKRADQSNIRDTEKKCIIEATFNLANYKLKSWFKTEDIDYDTETIVRREILPSGKSRAFINDSLVNLNRLTKLGSYLIDIHSQHQNVALADNHFQFQIIDALAHNTLHLQAYEQLFHNYKQLTIELEQLNKTKAETIKEHDYNSFLYNELEEAQLDNLDVVAIEEEYHTLSNVELIQEELANSHKLLYSDEIGILQTMTKLRQHYIKLSQFSEQYEALSKRLEGVFLELEDITQEIETSQNLLSLDPNRLEQLDNSLKTINNLYKKHAVTKVNELIQIRERLSKKVNLINNIDEHIKAKEEELNAIILQLDELANRIHDQRKEAIPNLINQLQYILKDLGMHNTAFNINVIKEDYYNHNGKDSLSFLFKANKGSHFHTLKKAASGGELARIMLAVKSVLANHIQLPTLIFDEIDTGVSGEISNKMALLMQQISKNIQVLAITHLPQIAAKGDSHYKVYKEDEVNKTKTKLIKLNSEERIVEIAQMLGGHKTTQSAIAHAKQLLN